jgi:ligand-binding sensor domain-containing protein/signal transduction histidine kinase
MLICFLALFQVFALDPARSVYQYNCRSWTRQNGLPANGINAIVQTTDGYIWLGTQNGLVRFDGVEFRPFDLPSRNVFRNHIVSILSPARNGGLWFGLHGGAFGSYDGHAFVSYEDREWVHASMNVMAIQELNNGDVWVGASTASFRWSPGGFHETCTNDDLAHADAICEAGNGRVWFGTLERGLWLLDNGKTVHVVDGRLEGRAIKALALDARTNLWVGTDQGLSCLDAAFRPVSIPTVAADIDSLLFDRHQVLWMGTRSSGLLRLKDGKLTQFRRADGLVHDSVLVVMEDGEGSLWVGTQDGLSQLSDVKLPLYSVKEGLHEGGDHDVCPSRRGGLWAATSHGICHFDGGSAVASIDGGLLACPYVKRVFEALSGDLYLINGFKGVEIWSNGRVVGSFGNTNWPTAFTEDKLGVILSVADGLFRVSRAGEQPFAYPMGIKPDFKWIRNLSACPDGSILVATVAGVFRLREGTIEHWSAPEGLPNPDVIWASEDGQGVIWAGTVKGVAWIKDGKVHGASKDQGLFANFVTCIIPDNAGDLWMNSSDGIFRVRRQDLLDLGLGRLNRVNCDPFNGIESVKTTDTTETEFGGCKTTDGRIWFPSTQGLIMVDPAHLVSNRVPPVVRIERVRLNHLDVAGTNQASMPPGRVDVEFKYSAPSFSAPLKMRFRYRLGGYDPEWTEVEGRRSAFYTNLKPGNYEFQVRACNEDGVWDLAGDHFTLVILPHYYQTSWFLALVGLIALAVLLGAYRWRVRRLHRKQRQLQEAHNVLEIKVKERTAELAEEIETRKRAQVEIESQKASLEKEVEERKRMELIVHSTHRQLMVASRRAGQAEVATNVIHNVGNVLNSVNVSAGILSDRLRHLGAGKLDRAVGLLREHASDLPEFLKDNPRGQKLVPFLEVFAGSLSRTQTELTSEVKCLAEHVEHIKEIVALQQKYATSSCVGESLAIADIVENALDIHSNAFTGNGVGVERDFQEVQQVVLDKHKLLQILMNILSNAQYACEEMARPNKKIMVRIKPLEDKRIRVEIADNGVGILPDNLTRIFSPGFSTRRNGHGFGLHSSALAAMEMGGNLTAQSEGLGKGAVFNLDLPSETRAVGSERNPDIGTKSPDR